MSSRKEYELLFSLKAALESNFQSSFSTAARTVKSLKDSMANANSTMGKIENYKKAQAAVEQNRSKLQQLTQEHERLQAEMQATNNPSEALRNQLSRNEQQIQRVTERIGTQETALENLQNQLNDAGIDTNDLTGANERLRASYEEFSACARQIREVTDAQEKNKQKITETQTELVKTSAAYTAVIAAAYKAAVDPAIDFESAFAGVKKTVNGSDTELEEIRNGILKMSTELPTAATEIAAVSEAAGQLGIHTDSILDFTKTMVDLGESTNLTADDAASSLAKFANVTGMSQDQFDELGSVIVELGNNYATTESDIVAMATRLASAGTVTGLSQSQIMAFSTALSSVGIEAEAGGSAASKMLKEIELASAQYKTATKFINSTGYSLEELSAQSDESFSNIAKSAGITASELSKYMGETTALDKFAKVAGLSADKFQQAYGKDSLKALSLFIQGLNDTERNGKSAIEILDDMDIKEVRMSNAILSLATSGDLLTSAVDMANEAWKDNTALVNEANQRYATTESKIDMAKNGFTNLGIAIGDMALPEIQKLAGELGELLQTATRWVKNNPETITNITKIVTTLASLKIGLLLTKFSFLKIKGGILAVIKTFTTLKGTLALIKGGQGFAGLTATLGSGTAALGAYAGAAAGVIVVMAALAAVVWANNEAMQKLRKEYADEKLFNNGGAKLTEYTQALKDGTAESLYLAQQTNATADEIEQIQQDIFKARQEIKLYGNSIRTDGTLTQAEAEALKEPFDNLCTALESDFTVRYDAVFTAFKQAASDVATNLGVDISEIETLLDSFKSKYTESLTESQAVVDELLTKRSDGGVLSSNELETLKNEMAYVNELSSQKSEALYNYEQKMSELSTMDIGENQNEAIENIQELKTYAEEYLKEVDNAQETLNRYYDDLRDKAATQLSFGKITQQEYDDFNESINLAQGVTYEAYIENRSEFTDSLKMQVTEMLSQIDDVIYETADQKGTSFWDNYIGTLGAYGNLFTGKGFTQQKEIAKGNAINSVRDIYKDLINEANSLSASASVTPVKIPVEIQQSTSQYNVTATVEKTEIDTLKDYTNGRVSAPGYASGTSRSVSTFLAGEQGPEIVTNMPGRTVYTASETADIFETYRQIIWILPELQRAVVAARATATVPTVTAGATNNNRSTVVEIHSSPTIQVSGDVPSDFESKLQQYNDDLLSRVDAHLRESEQNARRNAYE